MVYALHHPSSPCIYVGKQDSGAHDRPKQHGSASYMRNHPSVPVVRWISDLRLRGYEYEVSELEQPLRGRDSERFYIEYFRSLGFDVLNCTAGGEGKPSSPLDERTLDRLRRYINKLNRNDKLIAQRFGLSRTAITSAAAGLGIRRATAFTIRARLDALFPQQT